MVERYKFEVPLAPKTAARPRMTTKKRMVSMDEDYRKWRDKASLWFDRYLEATRLELPLFLAGDGYKTIRNAGMPPRDESGKLRGKLRPDFQGWAIEIEFVVARPENSIRFYPVNSTTADLDNYEKAVIDMMFESEVFKELGLNDRFIQRKLTYKRYTRLDSDEQPHIVVAMENLK